MPSNPNTKKGREAIARSREMQKQKREELKRLRQSMQGQNKQAKFSKQYVVFNSEERKQAGKLNTGANEPSNELHLKGKTVTTIGRHFRRQIAEQAECVQAGATRWSESIKNPAYVEFLRDRDFIEDWLEWDEFVDSWVEHLIKP